MAANTPTPQPTVQVPSGTIVCFPQAKTLTGTITSTGNDVIGTGTKFLTEVKYKNNPGLLYRFLFNIETGEIREILSVNSDTHLVLKNAFAADVSGQNVTVCDNYALKSISIIPLGADVEMFTPESASTVLAENIEVQVKDWNGILPIGLNCVSDTQVVTD